MFYQDTLIVPAPAAALLLDSEVLGNEFRDVLVCRCLRKNEPDCHVLEIHFREGMARLWPLFYTQVKDWPSRNLRVKWERLNNLLPEDSNHFSDDRDPSTISVGRLFFK